MAATCGSTLAGLRAMRTVAHTRLNWLDLRRTSFWPLPARAWPGRQHNFMAVVTAHPRAMHGNLATMEADLSLGPAPAMADAASATIMRRAGELLRVLTKHLFHGSDPGRQTEALKGAVHILPSHLQAGHERER